MSVLDWIVYVGLRVIHVLLNAFISCVGLLNILLHLPGLPSRVLLHFLMNVVLKHWHVYYLRHVLRLRRSRSRVGELEQDDEGSVGEAARKVHCRRVEQTVERVKRFGMGG